MLCGPSLGIAVPSGFFVPQLLVGAAMGRIMGEWLIGKIGIPTYYGQVRALAAPPKTTPGAASGA